MLFSGACAAFPGQYETRLTPGGAGATTPERQNMTRHSPYHGDKLSRPALSSEMSEWRHALWNQVFSVMPRPGACFAGMFGANLSLSPKSI